MYLEYVQLYDAARSLAWRRGSVALRSLTRVTSIYSDGARRRTHEIAAELSLRPPRWTAVKLQLALPLTLATLAACAQQPKQAVVAPRTSTFSNSKSDWAFRIATIVIAGALTAGLVETSFPGHQAAFGVPLALDAGAFLFTLGSD